MVSLRQIEAFLAVAETGHFGTAADRLGTTQPAISKRIAELEMGLGAALFDRRQRPPRLTERGHALRPLCEEMLALRSRMLTCTDDISAYSGTIRFGVTELVALTFLPELVAALRQRLPRARLRAEVKLAEELHGGVTDGRLDVVISPGRVPAGMVGQRLARLEMAWMCSGENREIPRRVSVAELARYPVLAQTQASGLQEMVNDWFQENGVRAQLELASNSLSALCGLTVAGLGLSLLPLRQFQDRVAAGELRVIGTDPPVPPLEYFICYPRGGLESVMKIVAEVIFQTACF